MLATFEKVSTLNIAKLPVLNVADVIALEKEIAASVIADDQIKMFNASKSI